MFGLILTAFLFLLIFAQQYFGLVTVEFYLSVHLIWFLLLALYFFDPRNQLVAHGHKILLWAVIFRIIALFIAPILEDDFYRYLWDGYVTYATGSPYGIPPVEYFNQENLPEHILNLLDNVNYPEIPTIYGPTSQLVFWLSYLISGGEVWALKLIFVLFDIGLLFLIYYYFPTRWFVLWAWNFLLIKEFAITVHVDLIGVLLLVMAFLLVNREKLVGAAIFLGLAIGAKIVALLAVPFFFKKIQLKGIAIVLMTLLLLYFPFLLNQLSTDYDGLSAFAQHWYFNSPLLFSLLPFISLASAKLILTLIFLAIFTAQLFRFWRDQDSLETSLFIVFAALFICSTVFNPWYWIWVLPWALYQQRLWPWLLTISLALAYLTGMNLNIDRMQAYEQMPLVVALEFIPIAVFALFEYFNLHRSKTVVSANVP